ncbi:Putative transmembrane protein [Neorhizobium galegae bv. orientalis]|nr:Putative transmembrane protein [Neorhizobium galegae bv. orientalis]
MLRLVTDRLVLPASMAALLMQALAYWWLDNGPHEIFGTAMFGLLGWHLTMNRRWFLKLRSGRYDVRRWMVVLIHAWLGITMAVLVVTSVLISRSVLSFAKFTNNVSVIELHWFSAYWVAIIVAIHAGTHWARVMTAAGTVFRVSPSRIGTASLRLIAVLLLCFGAWSFAALGVSTKLMFGYSLEFWDFTGSVVPFFAHWTGVMAGVVVLSHYAMLCLRAVNKTRIPATKGGT